MRIIRIHKRQPKCECESFALLLAYISAELCASANVSCASANVSQARRL